MKRIAIIAITALLATSAQAMDAPVNFSGTLIKPPPCVINSNNDIAIDFGSNLLTSRVDGINYEQVINYTLNCTGSPSNALKMQLQGTAAVFDTTVLATSNANLGVQLKNGGAKLNVNSWLNFTNPARPVLSAVPIKRSGSTLTGGDFTAASTLLVDYQ